MKRNTFWKDKCVLITGANGFLGSHLSMALIQWHARVVGIIKERFRGSYLDFALKGVKKSRVTIIKSDIINLKAMLGIFRAHQPDICLHVAAQPIVGIANKSPLGTFEANIKGTWNILEAARICKTHAVVVASSDKAYGEHRRLPYKEDLALLALHPYDTSKACADILTRCYAHTFGLPTAVTRCSNIYGPGDLNFSRIIPDTIRSIILNRDPVIRSDGTPVRDYVYVDDVVRGYLLLAKKLYEGKVRKGEAFNFGTQRPIRVLSLVNKILILIKKPHLKVRILSKKKIKGEIERQFLSTKKAKQELNWKPQHSLDEGLRKTVAWYSSHSLYCKNF